MIPELHLTRKDFDVDWFSGTGAGGQHRNKHMNCCRITHIATGLRATGQSHRDRPSNQAEAFEKLAKLVIAHYTTESPGREARSDEVIRTYNERQNVVVDKLSGVRIQYKDMYDPKQFGRVIEARASESRIRQE